MVAVAAVRDVAARYQSLSISPFRVMWLASIRKSLEREGDSAAPKPTQTHMAPVRLVWPFFFEPQLMGRAVGQSCNRFIAHGLSCLFFASSP